MQIVHNTKEPHSLTCNLGAIAKKGITLIVDSELREALVSAYDSAHGLRAVELSHHVFDRLISSKWPVEVLCRFISGWQAMHGTALFVSALMIRLHREVLVLEKSNQVALFGAASEIGEIIPEDVGIDDIPHAELFERFANQVVGNDSWKGGSFTVPACIAFRQYVKEQRLKADIEDGILTTAASENWNTGEFTFLSGVVGHWMTSRLGCPPSLVGQKAAYVTVHAGDTELGHFLHAIKAWQLYCEATNKIAKPEVAHRVTMSYLKQIGDAFEGLGRVFQD